MLTYEAQCVSDYELLRDTIIEAFDPADDDIAEVAILERAVQDAKNELVRLRAVEQAARGLVMSVEFREGIVIQPKDGNTGGSRLAYRQLVKALDALDAAARPTAGGAG